MESTRGLSVPIFVLISVAITMIAATFAHNSKSKSSGEMARLDRKLNRILEHLGLDVLEPFETEIWNISQTQGKIAAIKEYRERTGAGLAQAKADVEAIMRSHLSMTTTTGKSFQPDREV